MCGGIPTCALAVKAHSAGGTAVEGDQVEVGGDSGIRSALGEQRGLYICLVAAIRCFAGGIQLAYITVGVEVFYIFCQNTADTSDGNACFIQADTEGHIGRKDDLMESVNAFYVCGGVGFRIAQSLCLGECFGIAQTQTGHGVENIVAGAVHNAADFFDSLSTAGTLQLAEPADTATHSGCAAEKHTLLGCQRQQFIIKVGNQCLVGGNDIFARQNRSPDKLIGRMQTAHGFDNGINGLVLQDILEILGDLCIFQLHILQAAYPHNLHICSLCGQIIKTFSYYAESDQPNSHPLTLHLTICIVKTDAFAGKTLAFLSETVYHIPTENAIVPKKQGMPWN